MAFIADIISTNKALATLLGFGLVRCTSHQFNLAVKNYAVLLQISSLSLFIQLWFTLRRSVSANLRQYTLLSLIFVCPTRWSSTLCMLKGYEEIQEILPKIRIRDICIFLVSADKVKELDHICDLNNELESFPRRLQNDVTTISNVRALFNVVIVKHPTFADRLSQTATIVRQPDFENGFVKGQENRLNHPFDSQGDPLSRLKLSSTALFGDADASLSFALQAIQNRPFQVLSTDDDYLDTAFFLQSSSIVEP